MDFDPNNLGGLGALLGGVQQKVQDMKARAAATQCTGEAGGGLVKVTLTGDYQVHAIEIGEGAMDDRELLEDLIRAAMAESLRQVQDQMKASMAELTGGLPIPPGLLPF
ncbi:MAG TPA: YbaB/EbfC family nucleoid-associated protein [Deltaproteobacteria bacterium]|nr:YbaB/EbfC family nucleoid-associated protein [Deltaproteobacteria bacterium]